MKRRLARERISHKMRNIAVLLCLLSVGIIITKVFAETIHDGDKVDEETELTYYITVTSDGIDNEKTNTESGAIVSLFSDEMSVEDRIPDYLEFIGFETTETGKFSAVSQSDSSIVCAGTVIDDTEEESTNEGTWNSDQSEFFYHGLHYNPSNRTVSYRADRIQAGCELTIGIKVKTPTLPNGITRYDFYNTAYLADSDIFKPSNTTYFWMGRISTDDNHALRYEYEGEVPANAPALPPEESHMSNTKATVAHAPVLEGYTFTGWHKSGSSYSYQYPDSIWMPSSDIVLYGSFTRDEDPIFYQVEYVVDGEKPNGYTAPQTKTYKASDTVKIDGLKENTKFGAFSFNGWDSNDVDTDESSFQMPENNVTIRGSFSYDTYRLSYAFDGDLPDNADSLLPAAQDYEAGTAITLAEEPSAEGYKFLGWSEQDNFLMPENDYQIVGTWRRVADRFEPAITKIIVDPRDKYHVNEVVTFEVTVTNTANYPIYNVLVKEENEDTCFIEGDVYEIISNQLAEVPIIPAGESVVLTLQQKILRDEDASIVDVTAILSANANDGNHLNTDREYRAEVSFDTERLGPPTVIDNPGTHDGIVIIVSLALIITAFASLFIIKSRRPRLFRMLSVMLCLPATAGLVFSLLCAYSHAQQNKSALTSEFADYGHQEPNAWQLEKTIKWTGEDTATISLMFRSYAAERTAPTDLIIALSNDASVSRDEFDSFKREILNFAGDFLDGTQNRIGILSMDEDYYYPTVPSIALKPTNNIEDIKAAIDAVRETDRQLSNFNTVPINAAKLILAAGDGVERDSVTIAYGDELMITAGQGDSLATAKTLIPTLQYKIIVGHSYPLGDFFADSVIGRDHPTDNYSLDELAVADNFYNITLSDIIDTDEFEIDYSKTGLYTGGGYYEGRQDFGYSTSVNHGTDGPEVTINNYRVGRTASFEIALQLKTPVMEYHQEYTPNNHLTFDIDTIRNLETIASEHHELNGAPTIMNGFRVSYDMNLPEGCDVAAPASQIYNAATLVTISEATPSCPDYKFAGFSVINNEDASFLTPKIFYMPEEDVLIRATWTKAGIKKSMDGTVSDGRTVAFLDNGYYVSSNMRQIANYGAIEAIKTADALPEGFDTTNSRYYISYESEFPVYAWYDSDTKTIWVYTDADVIRMNPNSRYLTQSLYDLKDISAFANWDASKVKDLNSAFRYLNELVDLSPIASWDVSNVTDMAEMFRSTNVSDISALAGWDTKSLTNASYMFNMSKVSDLTPLAGWNTSSLTNADYMFSSTQVSDLTPLADWNTSSLASTQYMFNSTQVSGLTPLAGWNTSSLTNTQYMFSGTQIESLDGIGSWDVKNLTNISGMFSGYGPLTDISALAEWEPISLTSLGNLFTWQANLTDISVLESWAGYSSQFTSIGGLLSRTGVSDLSPLSNWDVSNVSSISIFDNTPVSDLSPLSNWRIDNASLSSFIAGTHVQKLDGIENLIQDASSVNLTSAFSQDEYLTDISALSAWGANAQNITNISGIFENSSNLSDISALSTWTNMSKITDLSNSFGYTAIQDFSPIAGLDVSNVTKMNGTFTNTPMNSMLPFQSWDTSKLQELTRTFAGCKQITSLEGLGSWDVQNVKSLYFTFQGMTSLTDVSAIGNWTTTQKLTDIRGIFRQDASVTTFAPLNNWNVSKVTSYYMSQAFDNTTGTLPSWYH